MNVGANSPLKEAEISIKVIRANGSVEDMGVVSYYHKNPLKRWAWHIKRYFERYFGQLMKRIFRR